MSSVFDRFSQRYQERQPEEMSIQEYLERCSEDPSMYASAAERMLKAIGEPVIIDTSKDERLGRIFLNRKIKTYPDSFGDFYGIEDTIDQIVSFYKHAAQGLEESRNILFLLGPPGSSKSTIAERLKELIQKVPFYTIKAYNKARGCWEISPIYESPLGLFDFVEDGKYIEKEYKIPHHYLKYVPSPWAVKRLKEVGGDLTQFKVVKIWPSLLQQIGVTKVEPGDENNQDISTLVGKVNIHELENFEQNDPDAYNWAGGLNVTTQGLMEFVEMFKAPLKMLHPLLTATQEGHYNGTEQFGAIPYQGMILAHANLTEWDSFRNNSANEAFIDRIKLVRVPYCLRVTEEEKIYEKLLNNSSLRDAPCAPHTLKLLAQFSVLTRLVEPDNSSLYSKMLVYDGENLKDKDPKAKSIEEYREEAGVTEGMSGSSTRFAFKVLSKTFNYDPDEVAANPIHLIHILTNSIKEEQLSPETEEKYQAFLHEILVPKYAEFLGDEIQKAYIESYDEFGQNLFERYINYADAWIQDIDYRDPDTGQLMSKEHLNKELEKIEKPAGIANPKDFRSEVVGFVLRARAKNNGKMPKWTEYTKLREVIEKKIFANTEELLPVISFGKKGSKEDENKHKGFVERMKKLGYTEKQIRILVEWFIRYRQYN